MELARLFASQKNNLVLSCGITGFVYHLIGFRVLQAIGAAGALMAFSKIPATKQSSGQRFDYLGSVTLFISLASFLLALTLGYSWATGRQLLKYCF